jgi:AcrR family transcriptional regulator
MVFFDRGNRKGQRSMARTRGRRPGGMDTRSAIVAEARRQFGEAGYAPTTLRGVAAGAGVDPRLVLHYFGSKRGLFLEAVELPVDPSMVVGQAFRGESGTVGERVAALVLSVLDDPTARQALMGILRSAVTDPEAAELVRDLLSERLLLPIAREVSADQPELRAALVAAQVTGLTIARHVLGFEPVASASRETLVAALAPVITHYLQGAWTVRGAGGDPVVLPPGAVTQPPRGA